MAFSNHSESRLTVYPNDFSDYGDTSQEIDYSDPTYYRWGPRSAQPVQPLEPESSYSEYSGNDSVRSSEYISGSAIPYDSSQMQEYRGPAAIGGYTKDVGAEQRDAATRGNAEDSSRRRKGLAGIGGAITTIGALLLKLKGFLFLLKFGPAVLSAIISVVVYSLFFGWQFAIGLVALLFIHEMGHALVMKIKGMPVGGMIFIPMLGAAVMMRQMPANAKDEAEVGIAGPIAGAIASSACLVLAQMSPGTHTIWAPLAYFGFFMNLFNLVPIVPFDGGRVLAAIDRRVWILGFAALLGYQIWLWLNGNFSIWLLFFVIIAATQLWSRNKADTPEGRAYYDVPVGTRIILALTYFGLAAILVLGMTISHSLLPAL